MPMSDIDNELRKMIDAAAHSSIDLAAINSLKELYEQKRNELNLSDYKIQTLLGMDKNTLNPILNGTVKHIDIISIIKLAHFLGLSVNDLLKIYVPEMSIEQISEIQRAREAGYIVSNFDVSTLTKIGFFKSKASTKNMSERIKTFFSLESLYNYSDNVIFSVFSRSKKDSNELIRRFWIHSAYTQFELINNPYPYDRDALVDLIPKIKPFTRNIEDGLLFVVKALYKVGVTIIFQPSISTLQIKGATFSCNNKPCIVLSDLNKNYPTLWFVLLHELHHVLYDFQDIQKRMFHLSGEGDIFLMNEERADDFALEYLLPESKFKYAIGYINSKLAIERLAKEWTIHPSIIYAIYCYKTNEWAKFSRYIPKMDIALEALNTHPFDKESLLESVKEIKELVYNI